MLGGGETVFACAARGAGVHFVELVGVFVDVGFGTIVGAERGGFHEEAARWGRRVAEGACGGGVFATWATGFGGCADGAETRQFFIESWSFDIEWFGPG